MDQAAEQVPAANILAETVDMALWKALRMQQGDVVGQAALSTRPRTGPGIGSA